MTTGEYIAWSLGQYRKDVERWQHTRKLAYTSAATMGGIKGTEIEFMPLPFDNIDTNKPEAKTGLTDAQKAEFIKKFREQYDS